MKFLVQSDDFGITEGVSHGIIKAIQEGIVCNTGLFSNMPWAKKCVDLIQPYLDDIAFGLDLNMSTGTSLLDIKEIPSLVQENGDFLTSSMNRDLDTEKNNYDHVVYGEVYKEFEAQILRFIELVGKKPDYLHGHAYGTKTTLKASLDLAKKYDILYSTQIMKHENMNALAMDWYQFPPTLENQIYSNLEKFILDNGNNILSHEYNCLITHCGYADAELFDLSSFNLYRVIDLKGVTSPKIKEFITDNQIELITYKDLKNWK